MTFSISKKDLAVYCGILGAQILIGTLLIYASAKVVKENEDVAVVGLS